MSSSKHSKRRYNQLYLEQINKKRIGWHNDDDIYDEMFVWIKNLIQISGCNSGKLLELGCGAGNISLELAYMGFEITGIDISSVAINWSNKRFLNEAILGCFYEMSLTDIKYESGSFDIIIDSLCLHCITCEDRGVAFSEIYRVLKRNGYFMVVTMCGDPKNKGLISNFDWDTRNLVFSGVPECHFGTKETINLEIRRANFRIIFENVIRSGDSDEDQEIYLAVCKK